MTKMYQKDFNLAKQYHSFVYLWYDSANKKYYLGLHSGSVDDRYCHSSSKIKWHTVDKIPKGWRRRILAVGNPMTMSLLEERLLRRRSVDTNQRYYNSAVTYFAVPWYRRSDTVCHQLLNETLDIVKNNDQRCLFYSRKNYRNGGKGIYVPASIRSEYNIRKRYWEMKHFLNFIHFKKTPDKKIITRTTCKNENCYNPLHFEEIIYRERFKNKGPMSKEAKEKLSQAQTKRWKSGKVNLTNFVGGNNRKPLLVNGIFYKSIKAATEHLGCHRKTITTGKKGTVQFLHFSMAKFYENSVKISQNDPNLKLLRNVGF